MAHLAISLLGPFQVKLDEQAVTGFESNKVRALLAYLAAEADQPHSRDELMGLLWPDQPDAQARNNLRHSLTVLRQTICDAQADPPLLTITRDSVQFNTEGDYWVDVTAFASLLATCKQHAHRRAETCRSCAQRLAQAVELYRGDFLEHLFADSPGLEEWALVKREELRHRALGAMYRLAEYHERRGEHEQARRYAARQLELDPWREEAHRQAMRALALGGQRSSALAQYEKCRRILADELSAEPDKETTRLYEKIKSGDLVRQDHRHNLPAQLSKFIGREQEIAQLKRRLDEYRLVTLTGSGGVGKIAWSLVELGRIMLAQGDSERAAGSLRESLLLTREIKSDIQMRFSIAALSAVLQAQGQSVKAVHLLGALESEPEHRSVPSARADYRECLEATKAALGEEAFATAWAEGRALTMEQAITYALENVGR